MRLIVSLAVLGLACAAMPAMAQQTTTQPQVVYTVPMYNSSPNSYYQPGVGGSPIYNNSGAQPYAMNQMIAGKNAPSYNFSNNTAYTGFTNTGNPLAGADLANLTPEQSRYIEQQRLYRVQQEQQAFLQQQQAQQQQQAWQQPQQQVNSYMQNLNQGYNPLAQQEQPRQRRVVYKERNNPLVTPPRLFDPDQ